MEQDTEYTPVLFRAEKRKEHRGEVTAVFPTLPGTLEPGTMTCYAHVGQHGSCSQGWYNQTRRARPDEYEALKRELEAIGYRLQVYRRMQPWHREACEQERRRYLTCEPERRK